MVVWGGHGSEALNTGGIYEPSSGSWAPTSLFNALSPRFWHTAVWTGSELLVWGGSDGSGSGPGADEIGHYNPGGDTWTVFTTPDAPPRRARHTAVWTGSEMVVWGGADSALELSSGGAYDPSRHQWRATSPTSNPSSRADHTAVWAGDRMIVWGGAGPYDELYSGGQYFSSLDSDEDGVIDSCDCAASDPSAFDVPAAIGNLRWHTDRSTLEWDSGAAESGPGTAYDVLRGGLAELPLGSGGEQTCVDPGSTDTVATDSQVPPVEWGWFYLVRGTNACGDGTYGTESSGAERTSAACP